MRQRNREDIDFDTERIEGDQGYIPEDEHTEQPDLTLENLDCIPCFPNNVSSLLGTTTRNNDDNQNIFRSVNFFVPQPQIVKVTPYQAGIYTDSIFGC